MSSFVEKMMPDIFSEVISDRDQLRLALADMTAQRDRAEGCKGGALRDLKAAQLEIVELRRVLGVVRQDLRQHELGGNSVWPSSSVILVTDTLTHATVTSPLLAALKLATDIEAAAAIEHERWSGWMKYLFSKCEPIVEGALIPLDSVAHWTRQIQTPYAELSEREKESDRKEARKHPAIAALEPWVVAK